MKKVNDLGAEVMIRHNPKYDELRDYGKGWAHLLNLTKKCDITTFGVRNAFSHTERGFKTGLDFRRDFDSSSGVVSAEKYDLRAVASAGCFADLISTSQVDIGGDQPNPVIVRKYHVVNSWLRDRLCLSKREVLLKWVAGSFGCWANEGQCGWGTKEHGGDKQDKYANQVLKSHNLGILGFRYLYNLGRLCDMDAPTFLKTQFYSVMNRMTPNSDIMFSHSKDYHKQHLNVPSNTWDSPVQAGLPRSVITNESHSPVSSYGSHSNSEDSLDILRVGCAETYAIRLNKETLLNYLNGFSGIKKEKDHIYKVDKQGRPLKVYDVTWVAKHKFGSGPHDSDVDVSRNAEEEDANLPSFLDPTKCEVLINRYIGYRYANRFISAQEYQQRVRSTRDVSSPVETCEPELLDAMKTHKLIQIAYISRGGLLGNRTFLKESDGRGTDDDRRMNVRVLHCQSDHCPGLRHGKWGFGIGEEKCEDQYFAIVRKYTYAGLAKRVGVTDDSRGKYQLQGKFLYLHCNTYNDDDKDWCKSNSELSYDNFNVGLLPVKECETMGDVSFIGSFLSSDRSKALPKFINKFNKSSKVIHLSSMLGCIAPKRPKRMEVPNRGKITDPAFSYEDGIFKVYNTPVARIMYHRGNYFVFYAQGKRHFLNAQANMANAFCQSVVVKRNGITKPLISVQVSRIETSDDVGYLNRWIDQELSSALDIAESIAKTHQRSVTNSHAWRYHKFASHAENLHKVRKLKKFQQRVGNLRSVMRIAPMILKDKARGQNIEIFNDPSYGSLT